MNIDVDTTVTSAILLSTNDAANFLGVSVRTFKYYVKEKKISPVQFGARGAKFYSLVQLENFKNENSPVQKRKIAPVDPCNYESDPCKIQNCTSANVKDLHKSAVDICTGEKLEDTMMTNEAQQKLKFPAYADKQDRIDQAMIFLRETLGRDKNVFEKYSYIWFLSEDKREKFSYWFKVGDLFGNSKIAEKAVAMNDNGYNVFFGVNLADSPMSKHERTKESDITIQTAIVADIDCQSSWHVGDKYPADFETAKSFLPFEPSILVDSGAGLHAYILLENPIRFNNDDEREQAVSRNKTYIQMIRDNAGKYTGAVDGVHDLPRVLRLPGTYNLKHGRQNAPFCKMALKKIPRYTLEELRELIKPRIIPAENSLIKPLNSDTDIYNTNLKNNSDSKITTDNSSANTFDNSPEYNRYRALKMLEKIPCSQQTYGDWVAVGMILKNNGNTCADWEQWSATDSARYKVGECAEKWATFKDNGSLTIATLHYFARALYGYVEKEVYHEWHEESKKFELKKILNSDTDVEKILSWQKLNDEIAPDVLKYLNDDAKIYLENLKEEDITTSIILSSKTKYAVANCLFYDFFSDCATNFVTRMKSAIQTAKEKVKSATAENPVADEIKSLSSIRPSDFDKAVSVVITEVKHKHRDFLFKKNIEKAKERREQYEQAPSTTRTNCPDCPVDLVLPYQTSFEKNRGIFANDDKGRPKCISRTPLVPTRQFVNPSEGTHHYEIAINTHGNEWQKVIYDAESLFNAKNIMNLVNDGARFSSKTAADVAEWLATILSIPENQESIQRVDIYNQPGWTDATCTEFIYPQNEEKYLVRTKNFDYEKTFAKRGDKSEWLKMFKKVLDKSAVTRLTLGAALSAPLVNVLNIRNLQLHLSCPSGNGKSALVKFATSAYGNPEKFKFKFNGTSNSFETQSTLFNDLPSWLEELQSANKKQRENIDQIIHDYESGVGRGRNTKNNFLQKQKYFHGCRISTGEQNLTTQFSGEGAISRILEIARADIFDNGFAIDVHKFCTENFGHFGQDWINFIIEYKTELCKEFDDLEKNYREHGLMSNHATTFAACHTAMIFFCKMLDIDANSIKNILIHDFYDFVGSGELPSKDRATNASRALQTVAETVASHPKFFKAEKYNSGEDVLTLANSDEGSAMYDYGFILKNGDVAIYPSALREILKDYPSVDALIRNFAECGYLDCGNDDKRPYQKAAKCQGKTIWVYRFKKSALEN